MPSTPELKPASQAAWYVAIRNRLAISMTPRTILLAGAIGILGGYGAVLFTALIEAVSATTVEYVQTLQRDGFHGSIMLAGVPAVGLLIVSWLTRRFAPEAQGHGVPEVITGIARHDGIIRPRVSLVKILASGICIGTGGSVGREGPIVQIGSSLGSLAGQLFKLPPRAIKVLVASGAAAGISATFHAPIAGVVFSSEIILGSFAVESLTPIVIAAVLADVVQQHVGEHGLNSAFQQLDYRFQGAWEQIPTYLLLGLVCGLFAVGFTKLLYRIEDVSKQWIPNWWMRAILLGAMVGAIGVAYPTMPPVKSSEAREAIEEGETPLPPLFGVGYAVVDHALHLEYEAPRRRAASTARLSVESGLSSTERDSLAPSEDKTVKLDRQSLPNELWWLLLLALLKPLLTSLTLAGGGSGGIFAPSLFIGATLGGAFGILSNLIVPAWSANPGVYAIVGMAAVVAGTTHGILSAILIVYEMTDDYRIILPIMIAAGLSSVVASLIDRESIYYKKLSRRGESIARGHDVQRLEHVMVRDVMVRRFPTVQHTDTVTEIVRVARANPKIESLPVMNEKNQLLGVIRPEDLHRVLDSDVAPHLVNAEDITLTVPMGIAPDANLLEALREFGTRDIGSLPVLSGKGDQKRLVGILIQVDVMRRYRKELLAHT